MIDGNGQRRFYDIVIDATNLTSRLDKVVLPGSVKQEYPDREVAIQGIGRTTVGKLFSKTQVYVGGPSAATSLTPNELATFPESIRENTVALWATSPRVDLLAQDLARQLT